MSTTETPARLRRLDDAADNGTVGHSTDPAVPPTLADLMNVVQAGLDGLAEGVRSVARAMVDAGRVPEQPPEDPAERALHLRRHRNTGPQVHADPRRNR